MPRRQVPLYETSDHNLMDYVSVLTGLAGCEELPSTALQCRAAVPPCMHASDRSNITTTTLAVARPVAPATHLRLRLHPPAPPQCTNENTGAPRAGCSAFKALKEQFDDSYFGNRAPTQILIHTPYLQRK